MIEILKRLIYWFWNPRAVRDKNRKVIDDFPRRRHAALLSKRIATGRITLPPKVGGKRCYKLSKNGRLVMAQDKSGGKSKPVNFQQKD